MLLQHSSEHLIGRVTLIVAISSGKRAQATIPFGGDASSRHTHHAHTEQAACEPKVELAAIDAAAARTLPPRRPRHGDGSPGGSPWGATRRREGTMDTALPRMPPSRDVPPLREVSQHKERRERGNLYHGISPLCVTKRCHACTRPASVTTCASLRNVRDYLQGTPFYSLRSCLL